MGELYDRDMDGGDGFDPAADASSDTGGSLRPVDDNGQETWAEDAEPLTRDEYAEQVRQSSAIGERDSTIDRDQDDAHGQADAEENQEHEELPEPRTRQEVAAEADQADPAIPDHEQAADTDLDASIAEDDNLPEPRTRQEVAEEERPGTDPLAQGGKDVQQHERDAEDWPPPDERARLHETYLDWRNEITSGAREQGADVVGDKPDQSPGDRRDFPPNGEELLESETGKGSRLDALRHEWEREEVLDGLHSEAEQDANTVQLILGAHPPEGHPVQIVPDYPNIAPVTPTGIEAGSVATAGLMAGVVLVEAGRRFHETLRRRRGVGHAR